MSNTVTKSQAISALPPDADGGALVPIDNEADKGFEKLIADEEFKKFLNRIGDYAVAQSNSPAMWERRRKTVQLRKYILGEYFGVFDKQQGWVSAKNEGDGIYFDPQAATFIDDLVASLVKAKPQLKVSARDEQRIDKREAAKVFEKLLELDQTQEFTPKRQQREWKWNLLAGGETYRITYFNTNKPGRGIQKSVYQKMEIQGGDKATYCPLCSSTVADESGNCDNCGNPQMDQFEVQSSTVQMYKGSEYCQIGDCDYDVPDSLEMSVIGDTDAIGEALIVVRRRMIPRCVLEEALDTTGLPDTGTPGDMTYKQMFESSATPGGDNKEFQPLLYEEFWVAPSVYTSYKFPQETMLKGGQSVPAGFRLKDALPEGFYFSRVKNKICQFFPQTAAECLSHAVNSIGEGFHGQGEWDLNELQDQSTELRSLKMNSAMEDSTSPMLIREGIVDAENIENKPGLQIPVSQDAKDIPLEDIMRRVPPAALTGEVWNLHEEVKGGMQHRVGAFSTQSDSPDVKAMGTATGVATLDQRSLGRRGPALMLYAQLHVDQAYQTGEMRRKYWPKKMYDTIAQDLGMDAVKWFMQSNIRNDFAVTCVDGSWMPQTDMMKRAGFEAYAAFAGKLLAARQDDKGLDELIQRASEVYNAGIDFGDVEAESVEAQLRLDKLQDVCSFVEQQFGPHLYDPQTGTVNTEALNVAYAQTASLLRIQHVQTDAADIFANLPLDPMFDTHSEFEEAYTDWLRTAKGRAASQFTRLAVRQLADYHLQAESYRIMKIKEYQNVAQIPDVEAQLTAKDAADKQQLETNAHQQEQDLTYKGIGMMGEQALSPQATGVPTPMNKITETMAYKDMPEDIKRQAEAQAGFRPSTLPPPKPDAPSEGASK
jgi:hypothetical protein